MNILENRTRTVKRTLLLFILCLLAWTFSVSAVACNPKADLTDFVSEYRNNLFLYEDETLSVKAHNLEREYPYVADGYKGEMNCRVELFVCTTTEAALCEIYFFADGVQHGGEASFDAVKRQFYFSCAADVANAPSLQVRIRLDETEKEITLRSVKSSDLLPLPELLNTLFAQEKELRKRLTENGELACELYVRILYEESPYFYVGIVDRKGTVHAFLLNGKTGEILAKRTT
ncbi:MAG: hypothetical protein IJF39_02290 [Clostridia bacterium]|nr:hypothetical protein [Clostridia bacterium]